MNRIFVAKKPLFISSNDYLRRLKKRDNVKKAGFSGILDPFACGTLVVAYGGYTRLFPFLKKTPKIYFATLWLGLESDTLDIEGSVKIHDVQKFQKDSLESLLQSFCGKIPYTPPKYSAKKINGNPAYKLAREGVDVVLKEQIMEVFNIQLCAYRHPFLSFKVAVSEGSYIRSLGQLIANRLGCVGSLSYLERLSEGGLMYKGEKRLNPLEILNFPILEIKPQMQAIREKIQNGKKVTEGELGIYKKGEYIVKFDDFFSIILNQEKNIEYLVNRIPLC